MATQAPVEEADDRNASEVSVDDANADALLQDEDNRSDTESVDEVEAFLGEAVDHRDASADQ